MATYGYGRVSTDGQEDNTSLPNQRERIAAFATAHALSAPIMIEEVGSGADAERPGLAQLRDQLAAGDTLIVLRLDRLFRSVVDGLPFFNMMEARGVAIRSVSEQIDTGSPMGRLMLTMILAFAQAEREIIAERMASGKARKAAEGHFNGGPTPYGYRRTPDGPDDFAVEPAEGAIVQQLFKLYATGRYGLSRLRAATGCPLTPASIAELLSNPFYLGQVRYDGVTRPNAHAPLVSRVLFGKAQRVRTARAEKAPRTKAHDAVGASEGPCLAR